MTTKTTTAAKKTAAKKTAAKKTAAKSASTKSAPTKSAPTKTAAKSASTKSASTKSAPTKTAAKSASKKTGGKRAPTKTGAPKASSSDASAVRDALRAFAFGLPGAWEDHPWGESVAKVGKKVFVFFGKPDGDDPSFGLSVKLPTSSEDVLSLSFAAPTGYGLGKAGWVSLTLQPGQHPPVEAMCEWIEESFRAVAPKTQVRALDAR